MEDLLNQNISTKPYMNIYCKSINLENSGGSITPLNYYEEFNFSTTLQGGFATPQSVLIRLTRIGRVVIATSLTDVTGQANATPSYITLTNPLPARFRPTGDIIRQYNHIIYNTNVGFQSHADIYSSGQILFGVNGAAFPTVGTNAILVFSFVWTI